MSHHLDHLRNVAHQVADATVQLDIAREDRDAAIRAARDAGVPLVRIAEAAGLTRRAVYDSLARTQEQDALKP